MDAILENSDYIARFLSYQDMTNFGRSGVRLTHYHVNKFRREAAYTIGAWYKNIPKFTVRELLRREFNHSVASSWTRRTKGRLTPWGSPYPQKTIKRDWIRAVISENPTHTDTEAWVENGIAGHMETAAYINQLSVGISYPSNISAEAALRVKQISQHQKSSIGTPRRRLWDLLKHLDKKLIVSVSKINVQYHPATLL